ncbi:MAG: DNA-protecting protein DprA [Clostridia bacterium]|nr:DNA-protecting protein DprA [Clostridia bacterium]
MKYTDIETDIITADSFTEINYGQKRLLLAADSDVNGDGQKCADRLIKIVGAGVYNKIREKFRDKSYRDKVLENYAKRQIVCVTIKSADYPEGLAHVPYAPHVLYLRGNRELLKTRMFAVVGARKSTVQAIEECKRTCSALTEHFTVVTGVADGADSAAVKGSLASGRIICVLPGGHDTGCSPNMQLVKKVESAGLTVSEFPPATRAQSFTFTMRNRIIAALADGVLVVSAGIKSGALSTANYANDYSKDVFAVPYSPGIPSGVGCNDLIKKGAYLCDSVDDIFGVMGVECGAREEVGLDGSEKLIYDALKAEGELHAEKIALSVKMPLTEVLTTCSLLEIKGLIIRTGGNSFSII